MYDDSYAWLPIQSLAEGHSEYQLQPVAGAQRKCAEVFQGKHNVTLDVEL